jgi:large conductance mechanosensitive channel
MMIREFREFIMRGNVIDLAVGIIIGAAFTAVVTSFVNDLVMPIIGVVTAGIDFSSIVVTLRAASGDTPAVTINIGMFINAILTFLITAFAVFLLVKAANEARRRMVKQKEVEAAAAPPGTDEKILATLERIDGTLQRIDAKGLPATSGD